MSLSPSVATSRLADPDVLMTTEEVKEKRGRVGHENENKIL